MEPPPSWRTTLWLTLLSVAGLLAFRIPHLRDALSPDDAFYMMQGLILKRGGLPYRDLWDTHAPGMFFFVSLLPTALLKHEAWIRLVSVVTLGLSAGVAIRLLQRCGARAAAILPGVLLFTAVNCLDRFEAAYFETEQVMILPLILMAWAMHQGRRPIWGWFFFGLATVFKQTAVAFFPLLLMLEFAAPPRRARTLADWGARLLAACAGWLAVMLFFAIRGGLGPLFQAVIFDALDHRAVNGAGVKWLRSEQYRPLVPWLIWAAASALLAWAALRRDARLRAVLLAGAGWLVCGVLYLRLQGGAMPYYGAVITPALLLVTAAVAEGLARRWHHTASLAQQTALLVLLIGLLAATLKPAALIRDNRYPDPEWERHSIQVRELARALRRERPDYWVASFDGHGAWYWYLDQPPPRLLCLPFNLRVHADGTREVTGLLRDYGRGRKLLVVYFWEKGWWGWLSPDTKFLADYRDHLRHVGARPVDLKALLPGVEISPDITAEEWDLRDTPAAAPAA